jgi:hypothetical protein
VTTYKTVSDEHFHKQAVGVAATATSSPSVPAASVASRPLSVGGQQMQSDPPRDPYRR